MNRKKLSIAAIALAAMLWGSIGMFIRYFNGQGVYSAELTFVRAVITALILFCYLFLKDRSLLKIKWKDIPLFIGTGIVSFAFFNVCYMNSITENSLSVAAILLYTAPVWVTLMSAFLFRDRVGIQKMAALCMVMAGCILVSLSGTISMSRKGLLFGLGSGLGYALYTIFGRLALDKYHSFTITFYTFVFAALGLLPLVDAQKLSVCFETGKNGILAVALAIVTTVIPYILYTTGLKHVMPSSASMISTVEPVTASVLGAVFLQEALSFRSIAGIFIVLGAICLLNYEPKKKTGNVHEKGEEATI